MALMRKPNGADETGFRLLAQLEPRERDVLVALCTTDGYHKDLAHGLGMGTQTFKNYAERIYKKAGVLNRIGLVNWVFRHRVLRCPCCSGE